MCLIFWELGFCCQTLPRLSSYFVLFWWSKVVLLNLNLERCEERKRSPCRLLQRNGQAKETNKQDPCLMENWAGWASPVPKFICPFYPPFRSKIATFFKWTDSPTAKLRTNMPLTQINSMLYCKPRAIWLCWKFNIRDWSWRISFGEAATQTQWQLNGITIQASKINNGKEDMFLVFLTTKVD